MTEPATDRVLLDRWRARDTAAFTALVERYQAALLRHARCILGVATPGGARSHEDIVQEVFLKLAQAPPELPPPNIGDGSGRGGDRTTEHAPLSAWLHTVTRNLCMDTLRSDRRRQHREGEVAPHEGSAITDGGLAHVEADDTHAAVQRSLDRLPQDQREVLVLRLLGEKSYAEIAAITGRKLGTVGWLISVGLKALSRELAPLLHGAAPHAGEGPAHIQA